LYLADVVAQRELSLEATTWIYELLESAGLYRRQSYIKSRRKSAS
jgi:hypothetical protein